MAATSDSSSSSEGTPKGKRPGFWSRFILRRSADADPEEADRIAFEAMRKHREKERNEFYSTQQLVSNLQKKEPDDATGGETHSPRPSSSQTSSSPAGGGGAGGGGGGGGTGGGGGGGGGAGGGKGGSGVAGGAGGEGASSSSAAKPQLIIFSSLAELPDDSKESIARMKVEPAILEANLDILANILSFDDRAKPKRRFFTPEQYATTQVEGYSKEKACNRHPPRMAQQYEDLFRVLPVREVKKVFKINDFLGEGGFGDVVRARVLSKSRYQTTHVAIKYQEGKHRHQRLLIAHEAAILKYCDHPCIVKLFDCFQIQSECWLVLELLEGGTLKEAAESSSLWSEEEIAYVAGKMLEGIRYLHSHHLVHRDLKNLNVMFTIHAEVKLIDFGLCCDVSNGPTIAMVGSPFWMAPEMIRGTFHSYPVDIWSFMICMLELANRRPPNCRNVKRALFNHAVIGLGPDAGLEKRELWSDPFHQFLSSGLHMQPEERFSAKKLLKHPFLTKATSREHMSRMLSQIFTMKTLAIAGI